MIRFGVSPAFVFSRHSTRFTVEDFCASLPAAKRLGFNSYQPEVYFADTLPDWVNGGAARLNQVGRDLGLRPSQFVAHFLMERLATPEGMATSGDLDLLKQAVGIARTFDGCRVLTVALGPLKLPAGFPIGASAYADLRRQLADKIRAYLQIVTAADLNLALEILPFSLVGNADGFLRLAHEIDSPRLGVNLDTGHAWAAREIMELLPSKLAGRVFGVHLKDNDSDRNQALTPGKGTIPWQPFLRSLLASGYDGSWDLEIACPASAVDAEYAAGRAFLQALKLD